MQTNNADRTNKIHLNISQKLGVLMAAILTIVGILMCAFLRSPYVEARDDNSKVVRVGWYESAYCYKDQLERRTGMAYEYQQKLVAYTGWTYEYVEASWPELMEMLQNGEIDLLSDVSYTKERAQNILYANVPMGSESYYIFIKAGNTEMNLEDISSLSGKIFAVDKGTLMESFLKEWAQDNGIDIEIKEITNNSVDESIEMLDRGEIDAYVTVDSYADRDICLPLCLIGSSEYFFAVNKNRPDLLKELNNALTHIQNEDPYYNQRLFQKYIWSVNTNSYLTENELAWLSDHGKIRVGYRNNYLPFCNESDGELTGALGIFLTNASDLVKNADIEFEPVAFSTTDGSLKALEEGEIDVVFPICLSSYDMEMMGLLSTESFMTTEVYAVVRPGNTKDIFNDENVTVALLDGNVNFDIFVQNYFPAWKIDHKQTLDECYKAVSLGNADCAMVNSYRITQNDRLRRHYKLSLMATAEDLNFAFTIRTGNKELYSILNKVINLTDSAETETNLSRFAGAGEKITFEDYLYDNAATAAAITLSIISLILFLLLTKYRSDKKADDRQKLISATELDPLTKLYTRNYFFEYATRMHEENPDSKMDAVVINIEQFHVVNAIYGWDYGDILLKALGDGIKAYIELYGGIACRSQADRFDMYCTHTDDHQAIYERLQNTLDEALDNVNIRIRMGVMPYQPDLGPVELFDRARTACSMVKGGHHVKLMVFNEEMRDREILEQHLLNDLRYAVDNNEFIVYYQPKYNVQAGTPILQSAEALVRWRHHDIGMIPPGEFISLFEKRGQIGEIDKYVWRVVARQISEWQSKYGISIPVSVNVSRVDIFDPNLTQNIEELIELNGLTRSALHLEITESAYTEDAEQIIGVVRELRSLGYYIEMDDFGTGYSSLNMLSSMPVDILKLDKSFIDNIEKTGGQEEKDIRMVELILDIAKSLKLMVVAEGVETERQLEFLKDRGCEMVQGYYFSPPLPAEEFERLAFKKKD